MSSERIFINQEKELIIKMYNDGETYANIRKILKCKSTKIADFLLSQGLSKRPKNKLKNAEYLKNTRKYKLNEKFFKVIDNDIIAYWLGFLYADGCVRLIKGESGNSKGGSLELALKDEDEYHLYSFLYDLKSDNIVYKKTVKLNDNLYYAVRTNIASIDMVNDLIYHGCTPKKSLTVKPPILKNNLTSHFIRGYFDGDGCAFLYKDYNSYGYEILGTYEILKFIQDNANISQNITIRKLPNKNVHSLRISGKNSIGIFHNYIYQDKTVFLERKYTKSLNIMKYLGLEITERSETAALSDLLD